MNSNSLSKWLLTSNLFMFSSNVYAISDYHSVIQATKSIIAGRIFENENGTRIAFSQLQVFNLKRAEMDVTISYSGGSVEKFKETIINEGPQVRVEQSANNDVTGNFLVSVESPFHVLRIRPFDTEGTNFISRECVYQANHAIHVCYIKSKSENDVLVSVFREIPKS